MKKIILLIIAFQFYSVSFSQKITDSLFIAFYDSLGNVTYTNDSMQIKNFLKERGEIGMYNKDAKFMGYYKIEGDKLKFVREN